MKLRIAHLVVAAAAELPGTPYAKSAQEWLETGTLAPRKAGCLGCHSGI